MKEFLAREFLRVHVATLQEEFERQMKLNGNPYEASLFSIFWLNEASILVYYLIPRCEQTSNYNTM
jgi:hypothetical protein